MRIISGKYRGRTIVPPRNLRARPTTDFAKENLFNVLVNLVDFDMKYGHRNDVAGYAAAMTDFDNQLGEFMANMREDDLLIITADHGCDPSTPSTSKREDAKLKRLRTLLSAMQVRASEIVFI